MLASLASPGNTAQWVSVSLASLASPRNTARQMSSSLASPHNTAWEMSASLASPHNMAWQMSASLASHNINTKRAKNASASTRDNRKICTRQIRCRVAIAYLMIKVSTSWSTLSNIYEQIQPHEQK